MRCKIPEGPEIRLSAEAIRPLILNKNIISVSLGPTSRYQNVPPDNYKNFIIDLINNCQVTSVDVKGKFMYWTFSNGWYMFCTFGMTGQFSPNIGKHPCLIIKFDDDSQLCFNDPRHFGTIKFTNRKQELRKKLDELGWSPFDHSWDDCKKTISSKIQTSYKNICQLLMDQKIFAGVGNYIKSESLYRAGISPWRSGNSLSEQEIDNLCQSIVDVMNDSYQHQGATISTYYSVLGERGEYTSCFKVYGRRKDDFGNDITTQTTPDKRTTHWCKNIQK